MSRIRVVLCDVVQTLFSLEPLRPKLEALGLPSGALETWFARTLRDGFALAAAADFRPFPEIAAPVLVGLLTENRLPADGDAVKKILATLGELPAESDVAPAFERLRDAGVRVVLLGNGSRSASESLVRTNGLEASVDLVLSVEEIRHWKPRREAYQAAVEIAGVGTTDTALISSHAWDVHGAQYAGLTGAWIRRRERLYSPAMGTPDVQGDSLVDVAERILALN